MNSASRLSFGLLFPALMIAGAAGQVTSVCSGRTIIASAFDSHGMPIHGLTAGDFHAAYRGGGGTVTSCEYRQKSPARVVVLLDVSGSMEGGTLSNKWRVASAVASEFVSLAPDVMQISLMSFASSTEQRFDRANGRKPIEEWLSHSTAPESNRARSKTALYDTVFEALHSLSTVQPGDSIYVITDGEDNHSKVRFSELEQALLGSGVRLYVFLLSDFNTAMEERLGQGDMAELARRTGGVVANIQATKAYPQGSVEVYRYNDETKMGIQNTTRQILNQMRNFYVLGIEEKAPSAKPKDWTLEVVDADDHRRKDVGLAYSHSLTNCVQQTSQAKQ